MKRLGLSPHLCAATLFLAGVRGAEEPKPAASASAPAASVRGDSVAAEMERRSALRAEVIKAFDGNGDGRLDAAEMAVVGAFLAEGSFSTAVVLNPTRGDERARLERVAEEVERRRSLRENGTAAVAVTPRPVTGALDLEQALRAARAEVRRLEAITAEVAQRRAEREKAKAASEAK